MRLVAPLFDLIYEEGWKGPIGHYVNREFNSLQGGWMVRPGKIRAWMERGEPVQMVDRAWPATQPPRMWRLEDDGDFSDSPTEDGGEAQPEEPEEDDTV
jgi:hypothetical protein